MPKAAPLALKAVVEWKEVIVEYDMEKAPVFDDRIRSGYVFELGAEFTRPTSPKCVAYFLRAK